MSVFNNIIRFLQRQPGYINRLLKLGIVVLFFSGLYFQVFRHQEFGDIRASFLVQLSDRSRLPWLVCLLGLMPLNWAAETMKWLHLIRKVEYLSYWKAFRAVIAGVTFSLFTPNRIGEFGGRILFVRPRHVPKAILSTLVGSFAQQLVLISFGFVGFVYFLFRLWSVEKWVLEGIILSGILLIWGLMYAFLNLNEIVPLVKRITFLHRFKKTIRNVNIVRKYTRGELNRTLFWASIRYGIYGVQYYLALRFFGIEAPPAEAASCIATVYLLQTSIPLPPLVSLLARGGIALKIWGMFGGNATSILAATFTLWTINLIIPALVGIVFIVNANILKSLGYEKKE